jgi:hypothetical protein
VTELFFGAAGVGTYFEWLGAALGSFSVMTR